MPIDGKKSLTLYTNTVKTLGEQKEYGETWDDYLLSLLHNSGRVECIDQAECIDQDRNESEKGAQKREVI